MSVSLEALWDEAIAGDLLHGPYNGLRPQYPLGHQARYELIPFLFQLFLLHRAHPLKPYYPLPYIEKALPTEFIRARGHPNIRATHPTTLEITKEPFLTPRGDCIIAVGADKGARDLSEIFKSAARDPASVIIMTIEVPSAGLSEVVRARGHPALTFEHPTDMVVRKSAYTCGRTIAVMADKAARDLSRELVNALKDPRALVIIKLEVLLTGGNG